MSVHPLNDWTSPVPRTGHDLPWPGSWVLSISVEAVSHSPQTLGVFAWQEACLAEGVALAGQQSGIPSGLGISCSPWGEANLTPQEGDTREKRSQIFRSGLAK